MVVTSSFVCRRRNKTKHWLTICWIITSRAVVKDRSKFDTWLSLANPPVCLIGSPHYPHRANGGDCSTSARGGREGVVMRGRREPTETACRLGVTHISGCVSESDTRLIWMWHALTHTHTRTRTKPSSHSRGPTVGYSLISHTLEL